MAPSLDEPLDDWPDHWLMQEPSSPVHLGQVLLDAFNNRDSLPPHPRLAHVEIIRAVRRSVVYEALNCRPAFRWGLQTLFGAWSEPAARAFMGMWHLPAAALRDLEWSCGAWSLRGDRGPVLHVGVTRYPGGEPTTTWEEALHLGYELWPPPLRNRALLERAAEGLVARAVDGKSWQQVAMSEKGAIHAPLDTKGIRDRTNAWAAALGVPLPQRASGRPRGKKPSS